jgi:hypothetical protein
MATDTGTIPVSVRYRTMDRRVENLLRKAGHLRRSASATYWLDYREKMLRVARELEARATRLELELEHNPPATSGTDQASKR